MNSLVRLISLILCSLSVINGFSQAFSFESEVYDFGTIAEDGGVVTTTFSFKNSGSTPAVIITASSSCGCTVPTYSRQPIAAGASSSIEVTYDPMGRPGKFNKTIQLIVAPESKKITLTIVGDVTPRKMSLEEQYPFEMGGGLRLAANYYPLSYIEQGQRVETQVKYINTSKKALQLTLRPEVQSGMLTIDAPQSIEAGVEGSFAVSYDLREHIGFYGALSDKFYVDVNGKESKYWIMTNGQAIDNFTQDKRSAPPICNIGVRIIRLGEIKKGSVSTKGSFTVENAGISDLIIRAISSSQGLNTSIKSGDTIEAGAEIKVEVWVDSQQLPHGNFSEYLSLTVNDPDMPIQRVRVVGTIID